MLAAFRVDQIKRLTLDLGPEGLHQPASSQFVLDQFTAHQGHTLCADRRRHRVGLIRKHQSGTHIQARYPRQFLPARPIHRPGASRGTAKVDQRMPWQLTRIVQCQKWAASRDEGVVEQLLGHQPGPAAIAITDGDIGRHTIQRHCLMGCVNTQINIGMGFTQHANPGQQPARSDHRRRGEGNGLPYRRIPEPRHCRADAVEGAAEHVLQLTPLGGQLQLTRLAHEQRHAQRLLQPAHLMTDCRGGNRQLLSGLFRTLVTGRRLKGTQGRKGRQFALNHR